MQRSIRYQGAIIRNDQLLLVKHREHNTGRSYWVIPGGSREEHETAEECVRREMQAETNLDVTVECLLWEEAGLHTLWYGRFKTYLCRAETGQASPGYEPEYQASEKYAITEVGWFDLRAPLSWDAEVKKDRLTYALLRRLQALLGYHPVSR